MKSFILILLLSVSICAANAAPAPHGFVDGNTLFDECTAENDAAKNLACMSYISGAIDAAVTMDRVMVNQKDFCIPPNVTVLQVRDIVIQHLRDDPTNRADVAGAIVSLAVMKAFPCT